MSQLSSIPTAAARSRIGFGTWPTKRIAACAHVRRHTWHQVLASHELGGAGLNALHIAQGLAHQGEESFVWIPGPGPAAEHATSLGLVHRFYNAHGALRGAMATALLSNLALALSLRGRRPGIVHIHSPFHYGALRAGLTLAGMKRVVHVQIEHDRMGLAWAFKRPPELIVTCAQYLVDYVRETLPESLQERQAIVALPNSVDTERFSPRDKMRAKSQLDVPPDTPLLLMLANIAPHKGQETAIRTVAELRRRDIHAWLWLAGVERDGGTAYTAELHRLISALDLTDRVRLLGYRQDSERLLQAADLFLLPSTQEGLPLALVEAQATKVPVLAAPTAGIPELICDGETGFLIAWDNVLGYANRMESLLENHLLYDRIAENAYQQVGRDYSWKAYFAKLWGVYEHLLAN